MAPAAPAGTRARRPAPFRAALPALVATFLALVPLPAPAAAPEYPDPGTPAVSRLNPVPGFRPESAGIPVVIAHRADHGAAHENTLEAIEAAIQAGVDYVELDVRRSRDGQHLLLHDRTVNRTTDGSGPLSDLSLAEARALRVVDRRRPEIPPSRIPTLEEALAACRDRIHLYLDFKEGDRARVTALLRSFGMDRRTLVYCGAGEVPAWRAAAPDLPLLVSPPKSAASNAVELVRWARATGIEALDGDWTAYSAEAVRAAEAAGIRVWPDMQGPWEKPEYWTKVLALGFTGVQSDHPRALIDWCRARASASRP